jgi:hypothetical protein
VILQKPEGRGLLVLVMDCRTTYMQLQLRNSNTSLLGALYLNYKGTALVFANKDMAFRIRLIDSIRLAIIKHITINSLTGLCNTSKGIIKGNHGCDIKV